MFYATIISSRYSNVKRPIADPYDLSDALINRANDEQNCLDLRQPFRQRLYNVSCLISAQEQANLPKGRAVARAEPAKGDCKGHE
jgi:hypothetical protein